MIATTQVESQPSLSVVDILMEVLNEKDNEGKAPSEKTDPPRRLPSPPGCGKAIEIGWEIATEIQFLFIYFF